MWQGFLADARTIVFDRHEVVSVLAGDRDIQFTLVLIHCLNSVDDDIGKSNFQFQGIGHDISRLMINDFQFTFERNRSMMVAIDSSGYSAMIFPAHFRRCGEEISSSVIRSLIRLQLRLMISIYTGPVSPGS